MMPRVLLVEDDRPTLGALKIMFSRMGVQTRAAMSLAEALHAINDPLDFIFLKLELPDGDGIEVLCHIRKSRMPVKVAVMSGADQPGVLLKLMRLEPDAIFGLPLDTEDFYDWLQLQHILIEPQDPTPDQERWNMAYGRH